VVIFLTTVAAGYLQLQAAEVETIRATSDPQGNTYKSVYSIRGLPQQDFLLNQNYSHAEVIAIKFRGTRGYLILPKSPIDSKRSWFWISPLWVAFKSPTWGDSYLRYYTEMALNAGLHVAGVDVGTTCGSIKGAQLYEEFYKWIVKRYQLNPKVRLIGQSNGGLIAYAWAFRHPEHVERIFGIYPATDLRTSPGLNKLAGSLLVPQPPDQTPGRITPEGLAFPYDSREKLERNLLNINPIENLAPLARAGIEILHIHGDQDKLVPMEDNSVELVERYRALGGSARLDVMKGLGHGGVEFFHYRPAADFLVAK